MGLSQLVKTHCPVGHPYDSVNTYSYKGRRACRLCRSAWKRQRRAATA